MSRQSGLIMTSVSHSYGESLVVDDVSLSAAPGELVCLLGPSGCGKTTTLRIAAGLEHPRSGTVHLNGELAAGPGFCLPPEKRHVGFLFQDYALFPHLTVLNNVCFGLDRMSAREKRARALEMLGQVGMADYADAWPHQLSGGQQQRVALARALAPQPSLMLLDEPFSGLDKRLRDQIRDETLHVLKRNQVAALMVTHDPEEAMFMADRIAVMRGGRIIQQAAPEDLYNHPADPFVAAFFGEVNVFSAPVRDGRVQSPLGEFAAPAGASSVQILIRPEGLSLSDQGAPAQVMASRLLGRTSLIHLRLTDQDGKTHHLHARLASRALPPEGAEVRLHMDSALVHIFPES